MKTEEQLESEHKKRIKKMTDWFCYFVIAVSTLALLVKCIFKLIDK